MSVLNTVPFEKFHGTGNDFFVVDADDPVPDRPAFARTHCDREAGITLNESERRGADGVLFLALESRYDPPRVVMTLVQPDGSVAAMCGNGARVAAAWAAERTGTNEVMIDTPAGTRRASLDGTDVTVEMGAPSFAPRDVPLASDDELVDTEVEGLTVTAVNTGVPHAVAFVDDVDDVDLESVAPAVRHAPVFTEGANVTLASPDGEGGFRQRTFERGVEGETQSCGTGAVAVVAAAKRLGHVSGDDPVTVTPPGGALSVTVPDEGSALLGGPAVYEGDGEADIVFRER
ncbi:diaminopimelate epimerase [Haloferax prahovense DSM 18310]|uniref:Diaminopimelate epimerase n=1 Tax=Haloferax prahovense (strain DSM 18310 / JCM 13924 / TL6) TaxID=1227461 RepID=M0GKB8_HALPT|nr:diaminopimelate epimerase [Haloferax prahovense]ELZ71988.1 diaminopimelate epimerase [Haloferax prahovense DSM 18310]